MSRVFLADEAALGRRVVVKVLAPDLAEGLSAERFAREVRLAARLQQPNILPVFATGAAGGVPYYTMPYIEGESLRMRLERAGTLSTDDAIALVASQQGDLAEVRRVRDECVRRSTREYFSSLMLGQMEQALGDHDAAFERYERAYQERDLLMVVFDVDPTFRMVPPGKAPITDDPRWASLVQRVGIAP